MSLIRPVWDRSERFRPALLASAGHPQDLHRAFDERLLTACTVHDPQAAAHALYEHLESASVFFDTELGGQGIFEAAVMIAARCVCDLRCQTPGRQSSGVEFDRFTIALLLTNPDAPELDEATAAAVQDAHGASRRPARCRRADRSRPALGSGTDRCGGS